MLTEFISLPFKASTKSVRNRHIWMAISIYCLARPLGNHTFAYYLLVTYRSLGVISQPRYFMMATCI